MKNILPAIVLILLIISCAGHSDSSRLDSDDYPGKEERLRILSDEIKPFSIFKDAEFELFNVNGFRNSRTSVPGASSWDYKLALKVDSADISRWTEGCSNEPTNNSDVSWTREIVKQRSENWVTHSKPLYFSRDDGSVLIIVFQQEGIIFKRIKNL